MWYTNGPLQNIALLSPFKLTVVPLGVCPGVAGAEEEGVGEH